MGRRLTADGVHLRDYAGILEMNEVEYGGGSGRRGSERKAVLIKVSHGI